MKWYDSAVFYHIYPIGMTGAPRTNSFEISEHRLNKLLPWIGHIKKLGCNAIYIGPLFESVGHGYETVDYKKLDSRLGDNEDLKAFINTCHENDIKVVVDGVFNHVGREFFAFKDVKERRENSAYKDWFKNLHFDWNNDYNDGLYYDSWDGHGTLINLNHQNPAVREYMMGVVRFWISEFNIDGIRLDAADVLDFTFMSELRSVTDSCKQDFWLMGEVIHGDYTRWVNENMLQSVTNYWLHKALYSGHNDHNYFEIAHTVKRCADMGMHIANAFYNFVDNHDVARIYTKLNNKKHFAPVHVLLYTLPGKPSIYYGSEFAIEGEKKPYADDILRPELNFEDYNTALESNENTKLIAALGNMRISNLWVGEAGYRELLLTNRQYAFLREYGDKRLVAIVNNDDNNADVHLNISGEFTEIFSGEKRNFDGNMHVNIPGNSGQVWIG
ncbi:alpha amylase, catalytic domain protein [Lachnoanaerobaculum sp. MSX33]|uniref:alpha-amylase family glycosyl hydrolase n=1 Tax=Lachnoanaerobaculum sp. MSX33 TaxID=936596 RepID=UPI0003DFA3F3|nr:alpha-amylase family glycosyl hydrolase [Lachnoanaerobaculum sp. MSX33]ETO95413.1 alpha amylase, catalytic domain protein [Lachnoanaerobaculum sp. MSX33]